MADDNEIGLGIRDLEVRLTEEQIASLKESLPDPKKVEACEKEGHPNARRLGGPYMPMYCPDCRLIYEKPMNAKERAKIQESIDRRMIK